MKKPDQNIVNVLSTILLNLDRKALIAMKASNVQVSSSRSLRLDIPDGIAKDGINRIKVTNVDGTLRVQLLRIEEIDLIGGVLPESLRTVLTNFTGVAF